MQDSGHIKKGGDMMKILNKTTGIILIIGGVLIIAADFLAGPLGLSNNSFGLNHILLLVAGIVVIVVGLIPVLSKGNNPKSS